MAGYLFAGQGAQYVGMGTDIHAAVPSARRLYEKASRVVGWDVAELCFKGPESELTKTSLCQVAILVTGLAVAEALRENGAPEAGCAAGLSLGEYTALTHAGAMEFEHAVHLVQRRGEFMQQSAGETGGGMASVIGLDLSEVESVCGETPGDVYVANINSPGQVVVSGELCALSKAEALAGERGAKRVIRLDVSGAFHSPLMASAAKKLTAELEKIKITPPQIPIFSNVTGEPLPDSEGGIKEMLVKQVTSRVMWLKGVKGMISAGAQDFIEIGPGKVLTGLLRRIDRAVQCRSVSCIDDI